MLVGHVPAGYILRSLLQRCRRFDSVGAALLLAVCLSGSVMPDLDMLYFYLVDNSQHHHHTYWSHYPIFWLAFGLLTVMLSILMGDEQLRLYLMAFFVSIALHLVLDSLVGDIWWLAPFVDKPFALCTVPARYSPWWLNFLLHWSFGIELLLCAVALGSYVRRRKYTV